MEAGLLDFSDGGSPRFEKNVDSRDQPV